MWNIIHFEYFETSGSENLSLEIPSETLKVPGPVLTFILEIVSYGT